VANRLTAILDFEEMKLGHYPQAPTTRSAQIGQALAHCVAHVNWSQKAGKGLQLWPLCWAHEPTSIPEITKQKLPLLWARNLKPPPRLHAAGGVPQADN
jgi:hypothetical protein